MTDWFGRNTLVTGGAGFIGSHLVDKLVDSGARVRILDDFSSGRKSNLSRSAEAILVYRADLRDKDAVRSAIEGCDTIFHLAAIPSVPQSVAEPLHCHDVNVNGTLALLEACREVGVRRIVLAASCAAYGNDPELPKREDMRPAPESPYASQKVMCEEYMRLYHELYGLETVSLRFFNVYGPRQDPSSGYAAAIPRFITASLKNEPATIYGDGKQTRDFVYVGDVASANMLAADAEEAVGKVINIASGEQISINEIVSTIASITGSTAAPIYMEERAGDVRHSAADIRRARECLGFEAAIGLGRGIERSISHYRSP